MVNRINEQNMMKYIEYEIKRSLSSLDVSKVQKQVKKADKLIDLSIKTKNGKTILIEIKSSGEPSYVYKAISQLKYYQTEKNEYLMVAVPSISERSKEICKKSGIGYIDLSGNVFVKYGDVIIDKIEKKELPKNLLPAKKRVKDLFSGNALRVLITLLKDSSKYFTQEELSEKLKLSKGYINRILKTFEEGINKDGEILIIEGPKDKNQIKNRPGMQIIGRFEWVDAKSNKKSKATIVRKTKKYVVDNPQKLLDILAKNYNFRNNKIISFYTFEKNTNRLIEKISQMGNKNKLDYVFTLHTGASIVAPFVRFEDIYFYVKEEDIDKWADLLELKRTEFGGNVFLVIPRHNWVLADKTLINGKRVINNILLYLDLINYPKRGKEQADFLREKKIGY